VKLAVGLDGVHGLILDAAANASAAVELGRGQIVGQQRATDD
jgi:hypothetical protein